MNLKYEDLHYIDLGASLRKFNDVIKTRKQGDMVYPIFKCISQPWYLLSIYHIPYWLSKNRDTFNDYLSLFQVRFIAFPTNEEHILISTEALKSLKKFKEVIFGMCISCIFNFYVVWKLEWIGVSFQFQYNSNHSI